MSATDPATEGLIGQALAKFQRREADALPDIAAILDKGTIHPHLVIAEAELKVECGSPEPLERLSRILAANPDWIEGHSVLTSLRFMRGDRGDCACSFREALENSPSNAALWNAYIAALVDAGDSAAAADAASDAGRHFDVPVLRLIEANHASTAGQLDRAEALLTVLDASLPEFESTLARHRIRKGDLEDAQRLLEASIERAPEDLSNWAMVELVWRARGDDRATWLSTAPSFCTSVSLELSAGELAEMTHILRKLHAHAGAPMGQSARGGSQTRGALFDRVEPQLAKLHQHLQRAVDEYRRGLPGFDVQHPLLRHRNADIKVRGGWSIRLSDAGFHVPHIHPAGVVSSAFYLVVPEAAHASEEGWFELGRPPADLLLDLDPIRTIQPEAGRLVLFPSYFYHGTRLFNQGERMSVAFDAMPVG